ncbi:hypothetical protein HU200_065918 [Digitaria exilis]|uniref:Uncharacterized protein n=1 Tax=Digitaria exilis TaxID=1010633 RepID=A0A834ZXE5_9POAL|nr:hypothetical protein HU200_065918 [Digitaria exilis]
MFLHARQRFASAIFREIIIMAMWSLWTRRNSIIFDRSFIEGMKAVSLRVTPQYRDKLTIWLSSLLM